jgi:hypothetical protein
MVPAGHADGRRGCSATARDLTADPRPRVRLRGGVRLRSARGSRLHVVIVNREDPGEAARMDAADEALVTAYDELGYPIGRTPTDRQE